MLWQHTGGPPTLGGVAALSSVLVPLTFLFAIAFVRARAKTYEPLRIATIATQFALGSAIVATLALVGSSTPLPIPAFLNHWFAPDPLSTCALLLVTSLAVVVVRYSRTYLEGQRELHRYEQSILMTLASVTTLVLAKHLELLWMAWVATSISLHHLLTFFQDRPEAARAARKKFVLSRIAEGLFFAAMLLIYSAVGSLQINEIHRWIGTHSRLPWALHFAAVLLVLCVALKSAQLPFHGWLIQVMEAPTPVSALLHAGVVNMGGFVLLRLAPLIAHSPIAQTLLVTIGTLTAVTAALVSATRVSVKVALAWSTCAQLGFMLVEIGLGAWELALLHLIAHSLYKAQMFLSSAGTVQRWRDHALASAPTPRQWALSLALRAALLVAAVAITHQLATMILRAVVNAPTVHVAVYHWALVTAGVIALGAGDYLLRFRAQSPIAQKLFSLAFAGFYLDELCTRWLLLDAKDHSTNADILKNQSFQSPTMEAQQ